MTLVAVILVVLSCLQPVQIPTLDTNASPEQFAQLVWPPKCIKSPQPGTPLVGLAVGLAALPLLDPLPLLLPLPLPLPLLDWAGGSHGLPAQPCGQ